MFCVYASLNFADFISFEIKIFHYGAFVKHISAESCKIYCCTAHVSLYMFITAYWLFFKVRLHSAAGCTTGS